jgi:Outer membrane protein beta-barrel domain
LCHLSGQKTRLVILLTLLPLLATAQWEGHKKAKSEYSEEANPTLFRKNRLSSRLHFGFQLALLRSNVDVKYSPEYLNGNHELSAVNASPSPGFIIGGHACLRISDFWDFKPQFNFFAAYERKLTYQYTENSKKPTEIRTVESAMFEVPLLLKYRAKLRNITNMYWVLGVKPSFSLSQKSADKEKVLLRNQDISIEYGFGFDVFFPYFKFAPELRFSHGLMNVLNTGNQNFYTRQLSRLTTHSATLYFHFGG